MTRRTAIAMRLLALVAVVLLACGLEARASEFENRTTFTINQPVRIPGNVVLPAGTYVMKRVDPIRLPHVVQILDATETKVYSTTLGIPRALSRPTEKPMVLFGESPAGTLQPLTTWVYPGRYTALEFPQTETSTYTSAN